MAYVSIPHITKIENSLLRKLHVSCASPCYVVVLNLRLCQAFSLKGGNIKHGGTQ